MQLPINTLFKLEESTENILKQMMVSSISQTEGGWEDPKLTWFKICTMVLKQ